MYTRKQLTELENGKFRVLSEVFDNPEHAGDPIGASNKVLDSLFEERQILMTEEGPKRRIFLYEDEKMIGAPLAEKPLEDLTEEELDDFKEKCKPTRVIVQRNDIVSIFEKHDALEELETLLSASFIMRAYLQADSFFLDHAVCRTINKLVKGSSLALVEFKDFIESEKIKLRKEATR